MLKMDLYDEPYVLCGITRLETLIQFKWDTGYLVMQYKEWNKLSKHKQNLIWRLAKC